MNAKRSYLPHMADIQVELIGHTIRHQIRRVLRHMCQQVTNADQLEDGLSVILQGEGAMETFCTTHTG